MNLPQIVKEALAGMGADKYGHLVPAIEQSITPKLTAKAKKLITRRLVNKVFNESLKPQSTATETTTEVTHD